MTQLSENIHFLFSLIIIRNAAAIIRTCIIKENLYKSRNNLELGQKLEK